MNNAVGSDLCGLSLSVSAICSVQFSCTSPHSCFVPWNETKDSLFLNAAMFSSFVSASCRMLSIVNVPCDFHKASAKQTLNFDR